MLVSSYLSFDLVQERLSHAKVQLDQCGLSDFVFEDLDFWWDDNIAHLELETSTHMELNTTGSKCQVTRARRVVRSEGGQHEAHECDFDDGAEATCPAFPCLDRSQVVKREFALEICSHQDAVSVDQVGVSLSDAVSLPVLDTVAEAQARPSEQTVSVTKDSTTSTKASDSLPAQFSTDDFESEGFDADDESPSSTSTSDTQSYHEIQFPREFSEEPDVLEVPIATERLIPYEEELWWDNYSEFKSRPSVLDWEVESLTGSEELETIEDQTMVEIQCPEDVREKESFIHELDARLSEKSVDVIEVEPAEFSEAHEETTAVSTIPEGKEFCPPIGTVFTKTMALCTFLSDFLSFVLHGLELVSTRLSLECVAPTFCLQIVSTLWLSSLLKFPPQQLNLLLNPPSQLWCSQKKKRHSKLQLFLQQSQCPVSSEARVAAWSGRKWKTFGPVARCRSKSRT